MIEKFPNPLLIAVIFINCLVIAYVLAEGTMDKIYFQDGIVIYGSAISIALLIVFSIDAFGDGSNHNMIAMYTIIGLILITVLLIMTIPKRNSGGRRRR